LGCKKGDQMPKVTIEFNLPEESEEYKITTNAME
jgi:hypothetical protein